MSAIEKIKAKARADVKHIVLPEGTEPRTVQASAKILKEGVARVTLLGNPDEVRKVAAETGTDLTGVAIIDPATSEKSAAYADLLYELRKAKGMTPEQATELVTKNPLYYGAVMLKAGDARAGTGENAVVVGCRRADVILGPIGIVMADALLGEITPAMAQAVAQSDARRILIPANRCDTLVVGVSAPIGTLVEQAAAAVLDGCRN